MRRGALLLLAAVLATGRVRAQEAGDSSRPKRSRLSVELRRDSTGSLAVPVVRAQNLLEDGVFLGAVHNGFPIRFTFRLSLWRHATLFDRLVGEASWEAVVIQEPVENTYDLVRTSGGTVESFADSSRLGAALAIPYAVDLLPPWPSRERYYYIASLQIESLTASELEEVQRWVRGDLGRAITRRGDLGDALARGARILLIRLSGLPHRSLEARTEEFHP